MTYRSLGAPVIPSACRARDPSPERFFQRFAVGMTTYSIKSTPSAKLANEIKTKAQYIPGHASSRVDKCKLEMAMATNHTDSMSQSGDSLYFRRKK